MPLSHSSHGVGVSLWSVVPSLSLLPFLGALGSLLLSSPNISLQTSKMNFQRLLSLLLAVPLYITSNSCCKALRFCCLPRSSVWVPSPSLTCFRWLSPVLQHCGCSPSFWSPSSDLLLVYLVSAFSTILHIFILMDAYPLLDITFSHRHAHFSCCPLKVKLGLCFPLCSIRAESCLLNELLPEGALKIMGAPNVLGFWPCCTEVFYGIKKKITALYYFYFLLILSFWNWGCSNS